MGIDLQALSITSAFNSILSFFKSQENNSRWKDLSTGAEGIFLIRMLANILSNISYRMITARRENFLSTANLLSSCLGISVNLGYSANRGSNQKRQIQFTPNGDYNVKKFDAIGVYNEDYDIITLQDLVFREGSQQTFKVVIGKKKSFTFQAGTSKVQPFTRFETGISEDFILKLNGEEVPTTSIIKELKDDKYLVRTNPYSSIDILYLNNITTNQYRYGSESVFTVEYIELADVPSTSFTTDMFSYGTYNNTIYTQNYVPFEDQDNMKINAPLDHEVQNLIRSKMDYTQRVKQILPNIIQTSYTTVTPTYALLSYLKDDYTTVKDDEIEELNNILINENYFGTPLPDVTFPRREVIDLNITVAVADKLRDTNDIKYDINNIIKSNYNILLNQSFNTYSLERLVESLSYVTWARVEYKVGSWSLRQKVQLGNIIQDNGVYYKASKIVGTPNYQSEPIWNIPSGVISTIDTGLTTIDGNIIWKAYKRLDVEDITLRSTNGKYKVGDYIYVNSVPNYMFKCIDLRKTTASSVPDVSLITEGDFVVDGNIVWVCKEYNDLYEERISQHTYSIGDSVNLDSKSFEAVSYAGQMGSGKPTFEKKEYAVTVNVASNSFVVDGDVRSFFQARDVIKVNTTENKYTFVVESTSTLLNKTYIKVTQAIPAELTFTTLSPVLRGTNDGDIYWEIIDDIKDITYGWNVYNSFSYDLTVV